MARVESPKSWVLLSRATAASTTRSRNVHHAATPPAHTRRGRRRSTQPEVDPSAGCSRSLVDHVGNPVDGVRHPVVDARLAALSARVAGRHDANQEPPVALLHHQRTARIALERTKLLLLKRIIIIMRHESASSSSIHLWTMH
jgi:hypothetical protein